MVTRLKRGAQWEAPSEPLDQREATRAAKRHPRAQAALRRMTKYVKAKYGQDDPRDTRRMLSKPDPVWSRLFDEWRHTWTEIRRELMGEAR